MRIVYLADAPYIHTRRWVQDSLTRGHECHVVSFRPSDIEGATVHHMAGGEAAGKARYLVHALRVRTLIRELNPDIVHALHLTSYGFLASLSGRHPLITSVWGTDILEAPYLSPFHRFITSHALGAADLITATSLGLAVETTRFAPKGTSIEVVPYGVDTGFFRPEPGPGSDQPPIRIGTAARLSPEKGIDVLLRAFAAVRQQHGEAAELLIAGTGPDEIALKSLARRLGIERSVGFLGWLDHGSLPAFLQGLDIFALPSNFEGFGVAAVEAASTELPVVASDVHGVPDVVRDGMTGILVPAGDSAALANALSRLINDQDLRLSLGRQARAYVLAHYDWADNTAQMDRTYARILGSRRANA